MKEFQFDDVKYLGECNNRLILNILYKVGDEEVSEEMFVYQGEYWFRYHGSRLARFWENGKISDVHYRFYSDHIIKEASRWCENLGLPSDLTERT